MVDNCRTFLDAAEHLVKKCGAEKVYIIATHGVLSGDAVQQIENCDSVYRVKQCRLHSLLVKRCLSAFFLARRHKHLPDPQRKDRAMQQAVYHRYFLDSR